LQIPDLYSRIREEFAKVVVGQEQTLRLILAAYFSRGHILFEGVPGIAKTLMAKTFAAIVGGEFRRVQFTPDMLPADIIGTMVFSQDEGKFRLHRGPIFCHFLLADEINRTPPKTQSALLEAMEERQVSIEGELNLLPPDFTVFATQNPIEYEGTYPLPEAQLDRFMLRIKVDYPQQNEEVEIIRRYDKGFDAQNLAAANLTDLGIPERFGELMAEVASIQVRPEILDYIVEIVRRTRGRRGIALGGSPRASIFLLKGAKALAALSGREFVIPDDVVELVPHVLNHRLILSPEFEIEGRHPEEVIAEVVGSVEVPR